MKPAENRNPQYPQYSHAGVIIPRVTRCRAQTQAPPLEDIENIENIKKYKKNKYIQNRWNIVSLSILEEIIYSLRNSFIPKRHSLSFRPCQAAPQGAPWAVLPPGRANPTITHESPPTAQP